MLKVDLERKLVVGNYGDRCTDICTAVQHLCDNGHMKKSTLLILMLMELRMAETAVLEAIKHEQLRLDSIKALKLSKEIIDE